MTVMNLYSEQPTRVGKPLKAFWFYEQERVSAVVHAHDKSEARSIYKKFHRLPRVPVSVRVTSKWDKVGAG